eukprot:GHVO01045455.1.p3 GENE.GHVO01045455.1~~GHVO01045455.1.p3  ORF type:complete len:102 (+),score=8.66 GHVO01045455.1:1163-1468(+)
MDIWESTYRNKKRRVLTMIDQLAKWAECTPTINKQAETVPTSFLMSWVYRFGVPRVIAAENGTSFTGHVMTSLCGRLGIKPIKIETFHRTLNKGLAVGSDQ